MDNGKRTCPYLGSQHSQESHFAIPTVANYCYKVNPQGSVRRSYQGKVCLTRDYSECPVFSQEWDRRLPRDMRGDQAHRGKSKRYLFWLIPLIVILAGIIWKLQHLPEKPAFFALDTTDTATSSSFVTHTTFVITTTRSESEVQIATGTSLPPNPTGTPFPTMTPVPVSVGTKLSPTPGPRLLTPFGPEKKYLLHRVEQGESLPRLAEQYQTSEEVIVAVNGLFPGHSIRPDQILVIMPGRKDSSGIEPLSTLFLKSDTEISELAERYAVSVDEIIFYNQLGFEDLIPAGRRLIFPARPITQTPTAMRTATMDLSKALTEPFGPENAYVLHRVAAGESIPILEKRYQTSAEVIQAANVIYDSIHVDQVLIIIPGRTDPDGVQELMPYFIDRQISVEELASQLETSVDSLVYYNELDVDDGDLAGLWIIYPTSIEK